MAELLFLVYPFFGFAFATSITPGPNNIMLSASGVNYGFLKTMPHLLGIATGFFTLMLGIAFGLDALFQTNSLLHEILKYLGSAYLLYLAWKIATSKASSVEVNDKKITFLNAMLFQFFNPKVWGMSLTAMSSFTVQGSQYQLSAILIALSFVIIYLFCGSLWIVFGMAIRKVLKNEKTHNMFNIAMGILLALTVPMIIY